MIERHPMHERVREWAYWLTAAGSGQGGHSIGYAKHPLAGWSDGDGYDSRTARALVPVNAIECRRTHEAIMACEAMHQEVLHWYYIKELTLRAIAGQLGVVSPETAQRRVERALDAAENVIHTVS